jgi:hypothetical protein
VNCLHFSYSKYPYHIRAGNMPRREASMPNGTHLRGSYAKRAHTVYSVGSQYTADPFVAEAGEISAQRRFTASKSDPHLPRKLPKTRLTPPPDGGLPSLWLSPRIILLFPLSVLLFMQFPRDLAAKKLCQTHDSGLGPRRKSGARVWIAPLALRHSDLPDGSGTFAWKAIDECRRGGGRGSEVRAVMVRLTLSLNSPRQVSLS